MRSSKNKGPFENVAECLYRYKPSGVYYARIKKNGKQFRVSLKTTDRTVAKANPQEKQEAIEAVDPRAGKIAGELCPARAAIPAMHVRWLDGEVRLSRDFPDGLLFMGSRGSVG